MCEIKTNKNDIKFGLPFFGGNVKFSFISAVISDAVFEQCLPELYARFSPTELNIDWLFRPLL